MTGVVCCSEGSTVDACGRASVTASIAACVAALADKADESVACAATSPRTNENIIAALGLDLQVSALIKVIALRIEATNNWQLHARE